MGHHDFYYGMFFYFCMMNFLQDSMGKTKYLKMADEYWSDTSPWLWIGLFVAGTIYRFYWEVRES